MPATPVPESCDLPPRLAQGLRVLVEPAPPTVSFTVLPEPESVTEARHFAVSRLDGWGCGALSGDVGLVVSELVTNALRHSGGPAARGPRARNPYTSGPAAHGPDPALPRTPHEPYGPHGSNGFQAPHGPQAPYTSSATVGSAVHSAGDPLGSAPAAIRLRMLHQAPWVLCGIMDASPAAPRRKEPDYIAETGRGLHLVESFSIRWGWCGLPQGKVVWALFRCS
ncbi:ATP-binding protein [Spirillospora sp. CA-255316]